MKQSIVTLSLLVICTNVNAVEVRDNWFGGFQVGNAEKKVTMKALHKKTGKSDTDYCLLKVGKYFKYGRFYMNYNFYDTVSSLDMKYFGAGYDYLFYNSSNFIPYLGINAGYSVAKSTGAKNFGYNKDELDLSGFTYGLETGLIYELTKNFDIELFASYYTLEGNDKLIFANSTNVDFDAKDIIHLGIGFNYNF